jgi:hypothetical protein
MLPSPRQVFGAINRTKPVNHTTRCIAWIARLHIASPPVSKRGLTERSIRILISDIRECDIRVDGAGKI